MPDLTVVYDCVARCLPLSCMQERFMQQAFLGLLLMAPLCAAMGVHVVNARMAFFSDAISHSAFAGIAIGILAGVDARWSMAALALLIGIGIAGLGRRTELSTDTVIGVFFSLVVAFGLAVVSRNPSVARDLPRFLYGDILYLDDRDILYAAGLFVAIALFQVWSYNRLLLTSLSPRTAAAHGVAVPVYTYVFAALLSLVVITAVQVVGVLLVTALLIVPAAAARNLARSIGGMFWWALVVSVSSAVAGLLISAQPWARTATGATIVLCAAVWFFAGSLISALRR